MEEFKIEKTKFIFQLRLTDKWEYIYIFDFFHEVFDYFRLRNLLNIHYFDDTERNALNECLDKLILIISKDLNRYLLCFKPDETYQILKIRSVLEFFKTDFNTFINESSKEMLQEMIGYDSDLWIKLDEASSNNGPFSWYRGEIPNIEGIPATHFWWTIYHRRGEENPIGFDFEEFIAKNYPNYKTL